MMLTPRRSLVLLLLGALGLGTWLVLRPSTDPDAPPPPPANVAPAPDVFALLVGVTDYPELKKGFDAATYEAHVRLRGPANDARMLDRVLGDYLGVPAANRRVLAGWPDDPAQRPTRGNILGDLDRLVQEVPSGARVIFMFAGHGSQQPAPPDRGEADHQDEIMLPADAGFWDDAAKTTRNAIVDDELYARLVALRERGATVWAIFDCCHSGTMMRGTQDDAGPKRLDGVRVRELAPSLLQIPSGYEAPAARGGPPAVGSVAEEGGASMRGFVSISAAHPAEKAPEMLLPARRQASDRKEHGLLSFLLAQRLMQPDAASLTLAEIFEHVRRGYASLPWTDAKPVTEGDISLRVRPGASAGGHVLVLRREAGRLVVEAGSLNGLTVGSVLEVFRPGGFGDPQASLGKVEIGEVALLRSVCRAAPDGPDLAGLPDGAPARVLEVAAGGAPLGLAWLDAAGAPLPQEQVERLLTATFPDADESARFASVKADQAEWTVRERPVASDGVARFVLAPTYPDPGAEALEASASGLGAVLLRVHWAASRRRLAREPALSTLPEGMSIGARVLRHGSTQEEPFQEGDALAPGDRIVLRLVNGTGRDVDVAIKNIDAFQVESAVWPSDGAEPCKRLTRDEKEPPPVSLTVNDDGHGRESLLVVVAVRDHGAASLHIGQLSPAALEGPPADAARKQDERAVLDTLTPPGSRGPGDAPAASVAVLEFAWTTSWGRMGIPSTLLRQALALEPSVQAAPGATGGTPPPTRARRWHSAWIVPGEPADPNDARNPGRADLLLLASDDEPRAHAFLVDADGDAGLAGLTPGEAARRAAAGELPVELLLVLQPDRSWAAYPRTQGDLALGLVLARGPGQGPAEERFELRDGAWSSRPTCGPWLSTAHLPPEAQASGARKRIRAALRNVLRAR